MLATTIRSNNTGRLAWAQVDLGDDDHCHLIDPEEHLAAVLRHQ